MTNKAKRPWRLSHTVLAIATVMVTPTHAADPVRVTAESLRASGRQVMKAVVKVENLTDETFKLVFYRCHFSDGKTVRASQLGIANNLRPNQVTYGEVGTDLFKGASVACEFERIGNL
jgi:hypothetical protein